MTNLEVKFDEWEWKEELRKLTLEDVGLGKTSKTFNHRLLLTNFISSSYNQCCWSHDITHCFCD